MIFSISILYCIGNIYCGINDILYLDAVVAELAQTHGWIKTSTHWNIKHQEEFIKPKKIISKIEFDSKCATLLPTTCDIFCCITLFYVLSLTVVILVMVETKMLNFLFIKNTLYQLILCSWLNCIFRFLFRVLSQVGLGGIAILEFGILCRKAPYKMKYWRE